MEFKSRTALAQHFIQLEKDGYIKSQWIIKQVIDDGNPRTKGTRVFTLNFDKITSLNKGNQDD